MIACLFFRDAEVVEFQYFAEVFSCSVYDILNNPIHINAKLNVSISEKNVS